MTRGGMGSLLVRRNGLNDLVRNRGVNAALLVVLTLAAFLMASGAMVLERVIGSINQLFDEAKPPHFLQMHVGDYDLGALEEFAQANPEIDSWLVEDMIGFESSALTWSRPGSGLSGDLSRSLIGNLFVTQNAEFDFLIDQSGAVARPDPGEVYVPVAYQQSFGLQTGDLLAVRTDGGVLDLTIAGFVRDSQMASSLSASTRFVVDQGEFDALVAGVAGPRRSSWNTASPTSRTPARSRPLMRRTRRCRRTVKP